MSISNIKKRTYDLGKVFHLNTKLSPKSSLNLYGAEFSSQPKRKKIYTNKSYPLKVQKNKIRLGLVDTLLTRKSVDIFEVRTPIAFELVSNILYFSYGIVENSDGIDRRTVPSAGARYPMDLYLIAFNVMDIEKGIYYYNAFSNSLDLINKGDYRQMVVDGNVNTNHEYIDRCSFMVISVANFSRTSEKYGDRGYRFIYFDSGHIAQNLYLVSNAQNIASREIGGFYDDYINKLLDLDGRDESTLLLHVFGYRNLSFAEQLNLKEVDYLKK